MNAAAPLIHVVDDNSSFRTAVIRLLRAAGYPVVSASFLPSEIVRKDDANH
jgi:FixJ family two-component response regulator